MTDSNLGAEVEQKYSEYCSFILSAHVITPTEDGSELRASGLKLSKIQASNAWVRNPGLINWSQFCWWQSCYGLRSGFYSRSVLVHRQ